MKLTPEHIEELYRFTQQHFVEWYDLQTELVDHLANDIEAIWEENPNLSFREAKMRAFKKFGIFGFHDVISDKAKAVNRRYWKVFWNIFKDYFKIPKIILTLLISAIIFSFVNLFDHKVTVLIIAFWIIFLFPIFFGFKYKSRLKKKIKKTGKKWMVDEIIKQFGLFFVIFLQTPIQLLRYIPDEPLNFSSFELLLSSFFLTVFAIFVYILIYIVPPKLEKEMCRMYPEYKDYLKA